MKIKFMIVVLLSLLLFGCNNEELIALKAEKEFLQKKIDSLTWLTKEMVIKDTDILGKWYSVKPDYNGNYTNYEFTSKGNVYINRFGKYVGSSRNMNMTEVLGYFSIDNERVVIKSTDMYRNNTYFEKKGENLLYDGEIFTRKQNQKVLE